MKGHQKMILEMVWDMERTYMFTASVDCNARSWLPEMADEVRVFEGGSRSIITVCLKGNICKWEHAPPQSSKSPDFFRGNLNH